MTESVNPFIESGIADTVLKRLESNYGKKPDVAECSFSVRRVEDVFSKKQVAQVLVEFQSLRDPQKRLRRPFAVGPTVLSEGKSIFTPEQQQVATNLLNKQESRNL